MKVLLLAGTREARQVAALLATHRVATVASLAGVTQSPASYPTPLRLGGFGGEDGQAAYLKEAGINVIIDATHPYATQISTRSQKLAGQMGLPYLRLLRPPWVAGDGDHWQMIDAPKEACDVIPTRAKVLLATGAQSIEDWRTLAQGRTIYCRRVDATGTPFPYTGDWIIGRPPFSLEEERDLLKEYKIQWLVTKNSGGPASAKLLAARQLGVSVVMLNRPPRQSWDHVETAEEALAWLSRRNG